MGVIIIRSIFIIKDGLLIFNHTFDKGNPLFSNMDLISGFLNAIQSFSSEVTKSYINTINFDNFIFHFYKDSKNYSILFVIITYSNSNSNSKEIICKIQKISSIFFDNYSLILNQYDGELTQFYPFSECLTNMRISQKNCGGNRSLCNECPYHAKQNLIINEFEENKDIIIPLLNNLLKNLLNEIPNIVAALVINFDGIVITQHSVRSFNEETMDSVMNLIEPIIEKKKITADRSFESGNFNTNEFRLFYLELGGIRPALLVVVADLYSDIDKYLFYLYIVGEKISMILNNRSISMRLPKLLEGGGLDLTPQKEIFSDKNELTQIIVIGAESSGKSSLIEMYINGKFEKKYKPTIGISIAEKELQITKEANIMLNLVDMGGLKIFAKVRKSFYKISKPKAILILFDYSRIDTLEKVNEWLEGARSFCGSNSITYFLIGNKIDLVNNRNEIRHKAELIASQLNCTFFETSALTGEGVDELFMHIIMNCLV